MDVKKLIENLNPADHILEKEYEKLNPTQKRFVEQLITNNCLINIQTAIDRASKVKKFDHTCKPRTKKVEKCWSGYKYNLISYDDKPANEKTTLQEIIEFKNFLKQFYKLDEATRVIVCYEIGEGKTLDEALNKYDWDYRYITKCYAPYVRDYSRYPVCNKEVLEKIGVGLWDSDFIDLEGCPDWLIQHIDWSSIARDWIEEGRILYLENPDVNPFDYFDDKPETFFYEDLDY